MSLAALSTTSASQASGLLELLMTAAQKAGCQDLTSVQEALARAAFSQQSLVGAVIATGAVPENDFLCELASLLDMEWREETSVAPAANVRSAFPARLALGFQVLPEERAARDNSDPVEKADPLTDELRLLVWDPFDHAAWQAVTHHHPGPVRLIMTTRRRLTEAVKAAYGVGAETFEELLEDREEETFTE